MLDLDALLADDELPEVAVPGKSQKYLATSGNNEWCTPKWLTELCAHALGGIDLDPCAPVNPAQRTVPAKRFITEVEDGLLTSWLGGGVQTNRIFLNPPYGSGIEKWVAKLAIYRNDDYIGPSIALLPVRTDAKWFQYAWEADLMCFLTGRVKFLDDTGTPVPGTNFASVLCYYGPADGSLGFIETFHSRGKLIRPGV